MKRGLSLLILLWLCGCELLFRPNGRRFSEDRESTCTDNLDNDGDGLIDRDEASCSIFFASCGDGDVEPALNEECDDNNQTPNDGCGPSCLIELCGDGITNFDAALDRIDECDDGNNLDGDGCTANCLVELCG